MKNLILFILTFSFSLYFQNYSFANAYYTDIECGRMSASANTTTASRGIFDACIISYGPRDKDLICALKAGKAGSERAAREILFQCTQ